MSPVERGLVLLRAVVALLLLLSLGGIGSTWLSDRFLFGLLLLLLIAPLVSRAWATGDLDGGLARLRAHGFHGSLAVIAVVGLGIRLVDIGHGLGHGVPDIDEHRLAQSVVHFLRTGTIDHSTVEHYPGLHFWMLSASFVLTYLWALMAGVARSFPEMSLETFIWAGRVTNAFLEAGTITLTGLLGRIVSGPAVGLTAAAVVAVAPMSLEVGTQLRSDTALTLFAWACVYTAISRAERPGRPGAFGAGVLAGCATAVKYSGVFAMVPVVLAFGLSPRGSPRVTNVALSLLGFGAALATTNHYIWADLPNFLHQLATEVAMTGESHWAATANPRWFYTQTLAGFGLGWPLIALAAGFGAYGLAMPLKRVWLLLAFPLPYVWFMTHQPAQFPRWVYPLTPCAAILAMSGLVLLARSPGQLFDQIGLRGRRLAPLVAIGLVLAVFAPFLWSAAAAISWRFAVPPHALAEAWLRDHAADGEEVLSQQGVLDFSQTPLRVTRVENLAEVLRGSDYYLHASHWVVVPEELFGDPNLARLDLAREFRASWTIGGNRGTDYRIYSTRPVKPLESSELVLSAPEAAPALGPEWASDGSDAPGLPLPNGGARIFLPASSLEGKRVEIELFQLEPRPAAGAPPIRLAVGEQNLALDLVSAASRRLRLLSAPCPPARPRARVTVMHLGRSGDAGPVRVVGVALR